MCSKRSRSSFSYISRTRGVSSPSRFRFGTIFENSIWRKPFMNGVFCAHGTHTSPAQPSRSKTGCISSRSRIRCVDSITKSSRSRSSLALMSCVELFERDHAERHVARLVAP